MASSKEYLDFILEQLSWLEDVSWRGMMGEFILYYKGRIAGGIYDDRLLVKRILNEEKVLEEGLASYREYEKKVKWRLIPFIW